MGVTNFGDQVRTFDFRQSAESEGFNGLLYGVNPTGIYSGFQLARVSDTEVTVSPGVCFIEDRTKRVGVKTECLQSQILFTSPVNVYIVFRLRWVNVSADYMDMLAIPYSAIEPKDLIVGRCIYVGSVLTEFDYAHRSEIWSRGLEDSREHFRVYPMEPYTDLVRVSPGIIMSQRGYVPVISRNVQFPPTVHGRHDLIWIDGEGEIRQELGIDSSTPLTPRYNNRKVIAEIRRLGPRTDITGRDILQVDQTAFVPSYDDGILLRTDIAQPVVGGTAMTQSALTNTIRDTLNMLIARLVDLSGVQNNAVRDRHLADMTRFTLKGRFSEGTGDPEDLSANDSVDLLNTATHEFGLGRLRPRVGPDTSEGVIPFRGQTRTPGNFYGGSTNPSGNVRLNYDGDFHASRVFAPEVRDRHNHNFLDILVGFIAPFAGSVVPEGWLLCNGAAVNRVTFSLLFARIGTLWGAGDGSTTFNLPDLRGMALRGTGSRLVNGRNKEGPASVGQIQEDQVEDHTHNRTHITGWHQGQIPHASGSMRDIIHLIHTGANSPMATGRIGTETRVTAAGILWCIKF